MMERWIEQIEVWRNDVGSGGEDNGLAFAWIYPETVFQEESI